jgi:hypothetical protein
MVGEPFLNFFPDPSAIHVHRQISVPGDAHRSLGIVIREKAEPPRGAARIVPFGDPTSMPSRSESRCWHAFHTPQKYKPAAGWHRRAR